MHDKTQKEGIKFISFFKNINQNTGQTNHPKSNIKTSNNHTSQINHSSTLKDGRLISSSADNTINIYKKDIFELQLSIKEHTSDVLFFTLLHEDRIISCSCDHEMNIIKLS